MCFPASCRSGQRPGPQSWGGVLGRSPGALTPSGVHNGLLRQETFDEGCSRLMLPGRSPGGSSGKIFWGGLLGRTPRKDSWGGLLGRNSGEDSWGGLLGRTPGMDSWWRQGSSRVVVRVVVFLFKKKKAFFFLKSNNYPNNYPKLQLPRRLLRVLRHRIA